MSYIKIKVITYSGYRVNERPTSLIIHDETMTVVKIMDKWIEESYSDRIRKRFFIVKTDNDKQFKIYVDEKTSEWFCEIESAFS
jgi:hypothetical protein